MKTLKKYYYTLSYIYYSVKFYHKKNWQYNSWQLIDKLGIKKARKDLIKKNYGFLGLILFQLQAAFK